MGANDKAKFKVGDRVRAVKGTCILEVGKEYTVTKIDHDGVHVLVGDQFGVLNYGAEYFEAAPQQQPLTIHAGRFYKTRDGRKVGPMVAHDYYFEDDRRYSYYPNGKRLAAVYGDEIIAEWPTYTSNPAAEVDNLRDEYGPVGANDNDLGSTAGFTVPVFDDDDFDVCGYRLPQSDENIDDDDIVEMSIGELTGAIADALHVVGKKADKPKTLKRGDLVVFNRPAMITGIDKYMVSVQTDGGNYSLPRAALRAA